MVDPRSGGRERLGAALPRLAGVPRRGGVADDEREQHRHLGVGRAGVDPRAHRAARPVRLAGPPGVAPQRAIVRREHFTTPPRPSAAATPGRRRQRPRPPVREARQHREHDVARPVRFVRAPDDQLGVVALDRLHRAPSRTAAPAASAAPSRSASRAARAPSRRTGGRGRGVARAAPDVRGARRRRWCGSPTVNARRDRAPPGPGRQRLRLAQALHHGERPSLAVPSGSGDAAPQRAARSRLARRGPRRDPACRHPWSGSDGLDGNGEYAT
jgi:hypothetical protein